METNKIYQMYNSKTIDRSSCVEIQLGKQRKKRFKDSSTFFTTSDFLLLEQTIWDSYREYSPNSVVKIQSIEWSKIIEGLKELSILLKNTVFQDKFIYELGIKNHDKETYIENYLIINKNIDKMVVNFIEWIEPKLKDNEYITITG
jgi:hypothetical protein